MNARNRTAGSVLSWALGVTLGVILGIAMLIVTPRLMAKPTLAATGEGQTEASGTPSGGASGSAGAASGREAAGSNETGDAQGDQGEAQDSRNQGEDPATAEGEEPTDQQEDAGAGSGAAGPGQEQAGTAQTGGEAGDTQAAGAAQAEGEGGNVEAGRTIYSANCAACHGAQGEGALGPSLVNEEGVQSWSVAQFTATLREGRTPTRQLSQAMPRFSEEQISDPQVADLLAYIKTLN
ncbi:c-type cytochrome [Deinococcus aquaedulcis]|uniref:c-type cytochrome n=1 Tax=Deinococcus aquaedulcis TaxID=2840455 RepID=UPI001C832745|nr:cytochrome c [Deinococcus aquaedulcis]